MYSYIYIYIHITFFCSQFSMSMWISFVSWAHLLRQVPTLLPGWPGRSTRGLGNQSKQLWPAVKKGRKSKIHLFFHALIFSYHLSSTGSNAQFHIEIVKQFCYFKSQCIVIVEYLHLDISVAYNSFALIHHTTICVTSIRTM